MSISTTSVLKNTRSQHLNYSLLNPTLSMNFQLTPSQSFPPEVLAEILTADYPNVSPSKPVHRVLVQLTLQRFQALRNAPGFLIDPENYIFRLLLNNDVPEAIYLLQHLPEPI